MMIAFIYPQHDYTAAEMAVKVQAFAGSQGMSVYSPPRNYMARTYNPGAVKKKLQQAKAALFLAYDVEEVDGFSKEELAVVQKTGAVTYFLVPVSVAKSVRQLGFQDNIFTYKPGDNSDLYKSLGKILAAASRAQQKPKKAAKPSSDTDTVAAVTGIALLVGLIILIVALFRGGGK